MRPASIENVKPERDTCIADVWPSGHTDFTSDEITSAPFGDSCQTLFGSVRELLRTWKQRARSRGELSELSEHDLRDIGMGEAHAQWEMRKPFWRA